MRQKGMRNIQNSEQGIGNREIIKNREEYSVAI